MPARHPSADAGLRLAMALLLLVSATTKVAVTRAIQGYMHAYAVPELACRSPVGGRCSREVNHADDEGSGDL
jgi:hypothetical protein